MIATGGYHHAFGSGRAGLLPGAVVSAKLTGGFWFGLPAAAPLIRFRPYSFVSRCCKSLGKINSSVSKVFFYRESSRHLPMHVFWLGVLRSSTVVVHPVDRSHSDARLRVRLVGRPDGIWRSKGRKCRRRRPFWHQRDVVLEELPDKYHTFAAQHMKLRADDLIVLEK